MGTISIGEITGTILQVRGRPVVFDADLAAYFGVETRRLTQAVKRHRARFEDYAFQITRGELAKLKRVGALRRSDVGGRRTLPWIFTEHGVIMAAMVLKSDRAVAASRKVVEAFLTARSHRAVALPVAKPRPASVKITPLKSRLLTRLRDHLEALMTAQLDPKTGKSVREETEVFISEGLANVKARLQRKGLENEEIEARVLKFVADAEESRARAATQRQMTERQRLINQANQLRLVIRAEIAMTSGEVSDLLEVLDDLGHA